MLHAEEAVVGFKPGVTGRWADMSPVFRVPQWCQEDGSDGRPGPGLEAGSSLRCLPVRGGAAELCRRPGHPSQRPSAGVPGGSLAGTVPGCAPPRLFAGSRRFLERAASTGAALLWAAGGGFGVLVRQEAHPGGNSPAFCPRF